MPQQLTQEQVGVLEAYEKQKQAQGQEPGKEGKKKEKSLTDIVKSFGNTVKKVPGTIDAYVGSGVVRSAIPAYFASSVALGALAFNPITAVALGVGVFAATYLATNTSYKLIRDVLCAPVTIPRYLYRGVKGLASQGLKNPFKAVALLATLPIRTPLKLAKTLITYPFTGKRQIGQDKEGKPIYGGTSKTASRLGLLAGSLGAAYGAIGLSGGLSEIGYSIKEKAVSLYSSIKSSLPSLRFKDGALLSDKVASLANTTKDFIYSLRNPAYSKI